MLHPAGPRKDLRIFLAGRGDDAPGVVEEHGARTGGALIERQDVARRVRHRRRILSKRTRGACPIGHRSRHYASIPGDWMQSSATEGSAEPENEGGQTATSYGDLPPALSYREYPV